MPQSAPLMSGAHSHTHPATQSALNPQQKAAVVQCDKPLLVLAGAGSGKTRVITHKISHLIQKLQIPAEQIVAVTFTNKAAREMKQRVGKMLHSDQGTPSISTFHSLGLKLLRHELKATDLKPGFTILDSDDSFKVIRELMKHGSKEEDIQHYRWCISNWKNDDISVEVAMTQAKTGLEISAADLYAAYLRQLRAYNAVDFDDLIGLPLKLLREHADLHQRWRSKISWMLVDEYQDTNAAQYELVKQLMLGRRGLTAVGDDDQSIYTWRGARPENLDTLKVDFPDLQIIKLEQNYRSSGRILSCANQLIANNPHSIEKKLWSEFGPGDQLRVVCCKQPEHEAETIASAIMAQCFKQRTRLGDIAILYRGNHQSRPLEKILRLNSLPYTISGGQSFFDRAEVKDILAYLRLITNPHDDTAFLRIINTPRRQIGAATLEKLGQYANQQAISLFMTCRETGLTTILDNRARQRINTFVDLINELEVKSRTDRPDNVIRKLLEQTHYADWLAEISKDQAAADRRYENVEDLRSWIKQMSEAKELDLSEALARISLMDMLDSDDDSSTNSIHLMTLHAAKGLEFPHVYLIGFEEGLLPHQNSIDEDNIEEERRLAYVGITRAQRTLMLSYSSKRKRFGEEVVCTPSRFLEELPREHLLFDEDRSEESKKETGHAHLANLKAMLN